MGRKRKRGSGALTQYLGQDCKKIHLTRPSDLGEFARSVLGLWQMGMIDPLEITGVLWVQQQNRDQAFHAKEWGKLQGKIDDFLKLIYRLKHPVTEYILDYGLPRGCGAFLPEGKVVHCPTCGCSLNSVPCVLCTHPDLEDLTLVVQKGQYPRPDPTEGLPLPKYRTDYAPGTLAKIEVMRGRKARGETCFHPDDQPLVPGAEAMGFWG
jgi:hypothetical protein